MHSKTDEHELRISTRDGKYKVPKFQSIFPYYSNPFDQQLPLMNEWMDWAFSFSLMSRDHYERRIREAGYMTVSYMYPFCKDIKRFERLVKWLAYLYICDDYIDNGRDEGTTDRIMHEAMDCIRRLEAIHVNGGDGHNVSLLNFKPFSLCAYSVVDDILSDMGLVQRKRFLNGWHLYCLAHKKEQKLIEVQLLELDAISKVRLESGAMQTLIALIEYSVKIHISEQFWYDDRTQRLMELCNLLVIFINDVYSFEKELLEMNGDMTKMMLNVVGFHVLKYKCGVEEGFERSLAIIRQYESEYKEVADSLLNDESIIADCKTFVEGVTAVNAGNFALCIHSKRFNVIYATE